MSSACGRCAQPSPPHDLARLATFRTHRGPGAHRRSVTTAASALDPTRSWARNMSSRGRPGPGPRLPDRGTTGFHPCGSMSLAAARCGLVPGAERGVQGPEGGIWEKDMTTGRKPGSRTVIELAPAAERGEHWWPVALAIIAVAGLHVALPARYRVQPAWVVPVVLLVLLAVLIAGDPGRIDRQKTWLRILMGVVIAFITLANLLAAVRLMADLLTSHKLFAHNPIGLLGTGGVIWATNAIAFGLWYWDLDRGGAAARAHHPGRNPAFVFPEMQHTEYVEPGWVPQFVDYLSLAFWTATAVSPTDISAIKPWAKLLMMLEAAGSIALVVLVIARAINVLQ